MKAPDKLYVSSLIYGTWQFTEHDPEDETEVEYIRKDALLEWAKEKFNEYKQMDEDFQGDVFIGNRHAFAEIIAKIESL